MTCVIIIRPAGPYMLMASDRDYIGRQFSSLNYMNAHIDARNLISRTGSRFDPREPEGMHDDK